MKNVAKNDSLPINLASLNHHVIPESIEVRTQLTEFRTEEHHEERAGTNIL